MTVSYKLVPRLCTGFFLLLLWLAAPAAAQELRPADGKTHRELLVSTQWLSAHLSDPNLVIIDVGMSGMESTYGKAHIPGARELKDEQMSGPGEELLPDDRLKANLESIGISDDSRVVIYSSHWTPMAARLFFTLDYIGFKNAALLDGGLEAWIAEKRPTSSETSPARPGSLTIHPHPEIVAHLAEVQKVTAGSEPNVVLLDARPMGRYKAGHLPGAVVLYWEDNLVSRARPVLKSSDELRKMYLALGVTPAKKIVSYCEVGEQAAYAYFIARYLGYSVAMYDGSYDEWSREKQPSVRGDSVR